MCCKGYSIALLLAAMFSSIVAFGQDSAANQERRIEAVDHSVDRSSQPTVKAEVSTGTNSLGAGVKVRAPKSASSWGMSPKALNSEVRPSSQTSADRTSPNASVSASSVEKAKLANQGAQPGVTAASNQAGSNAFDKRSSVASTNRSTVAKIGTHSERGAPTPGSRPAASAGAAASSAGASPSFAHGLEAHSLGASPNSAITGIARLRTRQQADNNKSRQKRAASHGLLSSGDRKTPSNSQGEKGPMMHGPNPPYGTTSSNDSFHPGQK